jgi:hypothetical protein
MLELLQKNWFLVGAFGTLLGFGIDRGYNFWKEKKSKQQAYNRLFTAVTRMYFSFIRHTNLYDENPLLELPLEIYAPIIKNADTFKADLKEYKTIVESESELMPEIAIQANELFDLLESVNTIDKLGATLQPNKDSSDQEIIGVKRAYFYSIESKMNEYFKETLEEIKRESSVSKEFANRMQNINSDESRTEQSEFRMDLMKRYFESLIRQGLIPKEIGDELIKALGK